MPQNHTANTPNLDYRIKEKKSERNYKELMKRKVGSYTKIKRKFLKALC